jgi:hypothetical protein
MDLISTLIETKKRTEAFYNLSENDLKKSYEVGKWSIRMILVHLADAESVLHERLKRIISEPKKVIWAFDQDLWCEKLNYEHFPLEISKGLFSANRESVIFLAKSYYENFKDKEFVHSETGIRTLGQEFEKIANHNLGHLEQIEMALTQNPH